MHPGEAPQVPIKLSSPCSTNFTSRPLGTWLENFVIHDIQVNSPDANLNECVCIYIGKRLSLPKGKSHLHAINFLEFNAIDSMSFVEINLKGYLLHVQQKGFGDISLCI